MRESRGQKSDRRDAFGLAEALRVGTVGLAQDVGHGEPEEAVGPAGVVDPADVGMLQTGGDPDLPLKPVGHDETADLGAQDSAGHVAVALQVLDQVECAHPARPGSCRMA